MAHPTEWLFVNCFQVELEFGNVGFCGGRKTGAPGEKPLSRDDNQQQTQPTYGVNAGHRTQATLVGDEFFYHCAIPAPCCEYDVLASEILNLPTLD